VHQSQEQNRVTHQKQLQLDADEYDQYNHEFWQTLGLFEHHQHQVSLFVVLQPQQLRELYICMQ
jgi:hypothetical protein